MKAVADLLNLRFLPAKRGSCGTRGGTIFAEPGRASARSETTGAAALVRASPMSRTLRSRSKSAIVPHGAARSCEQDFRCDCGLAWVMALAAHQSSATKHRREQQMSNEYGTRRLRSAIHPRRQRAHVRPQFVTAIRNRRTRRNHRHAAVVAQGRLLPAVVHAESAIHYPALLTAPSDPLHAMWTRISGAGSVSTHMSKQPSGDCVRLWRTYTDPPICS